MSRDNVVFTICGFLLGLIVGSFLIGPRLARTRLAGNDASESVAATSVDPTARATGALPAPAGNMPAGGPMAAVRERLDSLKQQIARNPQDFDALTQLANMYMDVGKYPQAIAYYEQALAVREEPAVRTDLGICYKQSNQIEKAIAAFDRVAREQPDQWQAVYNLAIIDTETHRLDDARAQLARLKTMNADPAEVAKLEQAITAAK